ncbi:hypothetical protein AAVH_43144 [Aphelenchoides avenae]|nr:hypothetical protein AAVH_43144 [Aphelenchus avenae]
MEPRGSASAHQVPMVTERHDGLEEELQAANAEIQRFRDALSGRERQESRLRQSLSEANADRASLRQSLEEAQRRSFVGSSATCILCEIRSIEEQIGTVQRRSRVLMSET